MAPRENSGEARLVIVEPGHYHAALIQAEMYPRVSPRVKVYAPLGPELDDYLNRVRLFNSRQQNPTRWELDIHTGPGFFERMLGERAGNVVVFAGRNREKIGRIVQSLNAGYNVLADKPWIIASADLGKLAAALETAEKQGLTGYDVMTERHEITSILQKEIVNTPEVFGALAQGSREQPAIKARSIHHLKKTVAGVPLLRPAWFFNIGETGEGIADVGTHVVDLVQWTAFPRDLVDYRTDIRLLSARRWPTLLSRAQFREVTGKPDFPADLAPWVKDGRLEYFSNTAVSYTVRGVHAQLDILWNWEAPPASGDVYEAVFRGTLAAAEIRQGRAENFRPELYVRPDSPALRKKVEALQQRWPGLRVEARGEEAHLVIPDQYRVSHEAHFAQVTRLFLGYLENPRSLPRWEKSNMMVKYYICTRAVDLARGN
ncbi:MAG: hypothetical protein IT159_08930 [Bryobacterales bacterium]|nr:hypothetical protein [Bryobacterales bacterium]